MEKTGKEGGIMRILNEKDMWESITLDDVMESIEHAFAVHRSLDYVMPDRLAVEKGGNILMFMPCLMRDAWGTKMLSEFPSNPAKGKLLLDGLMILNDSEDGSVRAIMNGSALTAIRTGAVGGTALRHLAPADVHSIGLVGCGVQGFHQLLYACHVRDIRDVYLFDAWKKDLSSFMARLQERTDQKLTFHVCEDAVELAANSEVIMTATQAKDPLFPDDVELLEGKTFVSIGSWHPDCRELPDAVSRLVDQVWIDLPYACEESGDLRMPLDNGALPRTKVRLFEDLLADEKEGIHPEHGTTRWFKTVGMGIFDTAAAEMICRRAEEKGIGQVVDW